MGVKYALVVPTGVLQNSSEIFDILDTSGGGSKTFTVPLSADGNDPATHYGAFGVLPEGFLDAMALTTPEFLAFCNEKADLVFKPRLTGAAAFKNSIQIGAPDQDFYEFVASLGLQRIEPQI